MMRRSIIVIGLLLLVSGCGPAKHSGSSSGYKGSKFESEICQRRNRDDVVRGLPGEPQTLDPQLADDEFSFQVVRDLYEGLTSENKYGVIAPGVARSWTVSKKGTEYTFHLRAHARWSDGTPVTARQFVNGLQRAVDPATASGSAELLEAIKGAKSIIAGHKRSTSLGVRAIGSNVVIVRLSSPAPYILQVLSQPIAAPLYHRLSNTRHVANPHVTDGPYVLVDQIYGSYVELAKNPYYWDARHVAIPRVRYLISGSESTELNEFLAGQIDITYPVPMPDLTRMLAGLPTEVQVAPILTTFYLAFNLSEPRLKQSRELRQALSMGIDRRLIAAKVMLGVTPAYSFVPPAINNYTPPIYQWSMWTRARRLAYARKLFASAGYTKSHPLKLKLYFNNDQTIRRVMLAIANNWQENLGVSVHLISDEFRLFLARRKDRSYWDIARFGWNADYDDAASFLDVFARNSPQNDADYQNTSYNLLLGKARHEPNVNSRRILLEHAESVLLNDYGLIPVYFYNARRMVNPCLGGATITPMNRTYSKYLYWKANPALRNDASEAFGGANSHSHS